MTLDELDAEHWNICGVDILFVRATVDKPFAGAGVVVVDITAPPCIEALRKAMRFADALLIRRGKRWGAVQVADALVGNMEPARWHTSPFAALKRVGE